MDEYCLPAIKNQNIPELKKWLEHPMSFGTRSVQSLRDASIGCGVKTGNIEIVKLLLTSYAGFISSAHYGYDNVPLVLASK